MESGIKDLLSGANGKLYAKIVSKAHKYDLAHLTFQSIWEAYEEYKNKMNGNEKKSHNNTNGKIFEYAICDVLSLHGVTNLYFQCEFWSMPNDRIDIGGWTKDKYPIIISCKTSLRERWKQADMEGRLLKGIFPKTKSFIVVVEDKGTDLLQKRISEHAVAGLDKVILANMPQFDTFVEDILDLNLTETSEIQPLKGKRF